MNTITRTLVGVAGTALVLGSLAACGSDDSTPATAAPAGVRLPTVSRTVFAERGNALCRASSEAIGSKFRAMSTPPKPAELQAAYDNMLTQSYKVVGALLEIGAPAGQERAFLDAVVEQYTITAGVEQQGAEKFFADEGSDPWADLTETLATDFGLTDCKQQG